MSDLASKECVSCKGGVPPLKGAELEALLREVNNGWQVVDKHHLEKEYRFQNFREALDFTIRVGRARGSATPSPGHRSRVGGRFGSPSGRTRSTA
jgi:Pterin 4 alpha carbinolamine dehydratase